MKEYIKLTIQLKKSIKELHECIHEQRDTNYEQGDRPFHTSVFWGILHTIDGLNLKNCQKVSKGRNQFAWHI